MYTHAQTHMHNTHTLPVLGAEPLTEGGEKGVGTWRRGPLAPLFLWAEQKRVSGRNVELPPNGSSQKPISSHLLGLLHPAG